MRAIESSNSPIFKNKQELFHGQPQVQREQDHQPQQQAQHGQHVGRHPGLPVALTELLIWQNIPKSPHNIMLQRKLGQFLALLDEVDQHG